MSTLPHSEVELSDALEALAIIAPKQPSLQGDDVPVDIWLDILHHLGYKDVVSMALVCKALHAIISEKQVWIEYLRGMCERHALFYPSYPVDSMNVQELQQAILGPERFNDTLRRGPGSPVYTDSSPILSPAAITSFPNHDACHGVHESSIGLFLVPGGRFLVSSNPDSLALWDIGAAVGQKRVESPILLAKYEHPAHGPGSAKVDDNTVLDLAVTPFGERKLRIAVAMYHPEQIVTVTALEIGFPCDPGSSFRPLATLRISVPSEIIEEYGVAVLCHNLLISGDTIHVQLVVNQPETETVIWNFEDEICGLRDARSDIPQTDYWLMRALRTELPVIYRLYASYTPRYGPKAPVMAHSTPARTWGDTTFSTSSDEPISIPGDHARLESSEKVMYSPIPAGDQTARQTFYETVVASGWYQSIPSLPLYFNLMELRRHTADPEELGIFSSTHHTYHISEEWAKTQSVQTFLVDFEPYVRLPVWLRHCQEPLSIAPQEPGVMWGYSGPTTPARMSGDPFVVVIRHMERTLDPIWALVSQPEAPITNPPVEGEETQVAPPEEDDIATITVLHRDKNEPDGGLKSAMICLATGRMVFATHGDVLCIHDYLPPSSA
ncbi:hypothetical protein DFP72DRAFT_1039306 [Ephemerocybe angulata]|uniref:F-box domain-containing protein n=1 Tax=Ephemerocybe angulata TaxID=980116 RepID=A0A8H6IJI7_9AGAR|nr:hypothetical protein DFP72DRAFT_1039306 [Tulosesus angulatus]